MQSEWQPKVQLSIEVTHWNYCFSLQFLPKLKKSAGRGTKTTLGKKKKRKQITGILKLTVLVLITLTKRDSICNFCFALFDSGN